MISLGRVVISFLVLVIVCLLFWTLISLETSPFYVLSNIDHNLTFSNSIIDTWAIRGQIGDILAGHFSALAFIGIALSIYLQNHSNRQMKESIKIQREEFFINNMNMKLDRYYQILDGNLKIVTEEYLYDYLGKINVIRELSKLNLQEENEKVINEYKISTNEQATKIRPIVMTLNFIYSEIIKIKKSSPLGYQTYIEELRLRLYSNEIFHTIHTSIEEYQNIPVFDLYNKDN